MSFCVCSWLLISGSSGTMEKCVDRASHFKINSVLFVCDHLVVVFCHFKVLFPNQKYLVLPAGSKKWYFVSSPVENTDCKVSIIKWQEIVCLPGIYHTVRKWHPLPYHNGHLFTTSWSQKFTFCQLAHSKLCPFTVRFPQLSFLVKKTFHSSTSQWQSCQKVTILRVSMDREFECWLESRTAVQLWSIYDDVACRL